jgi:hypothetical protein
LRIQGRLHALCCQSEYLASKPIYRHPFVQRLRSPRLALIRTTGGSRGCEDERAADLSQAERSPSYVRDDNHHHNAPTSSLNSKILSVMKRYDTHLITDRGALFNRRLRLFDPRLCRDRPEGEMRTISKLKQSTPTFDDSKSEI